MRQSPTQDCNSEKHKEEKEKEENVEEKGKARLDARNFSDWGGWSVTMTR